jgi:hypothetical protein
MKLREDQFSAPLYLDASVAVKLLIEEEHSEKVKNYFERKVASMTVFCFHEMMCPGFSVHWILYYSVSV